LIGSNFNFFLLPFDRIIFTLIISYFTPLDIIHKSLDIIHKY